MTAIKKYNPGEFCWTDLGTRDAAGAKKFYRGIFGWEVEDMPIGTGDAFYSLLRVDGKDVCALYPMSDEQRKTKAPPFWLPYVAVRNVARTVGTVKAAGGTVCMGPVNAQDKGRMAILQDPAGANFALWQARAHVGTRLRNMPGTVCWHDLSTPKTDAGGKFYGKVFKWKTQSKDFNGNAYHLLMLGNKDVGGMWPEPMKKLPPCWVTYWQVANCARTVTKVKRLGGGVLLGTTTVPDICSFAVLTDPQGAVFGILEPK
jgi:hypothetical protein